MTWFLMALRFLPMILEAIKATEKIIGPGEGKAKKQLVLNAAQAAAKAAGPVDSKSIKLVSELVDLTVDTLNKAGVLKKPVLDT